MKTAGTRLGAPTTVAEDDLRQLAERPTFRTTLSFARLTAAEPLKQLRSRGFAEGFSANVLA